MIDVPENIPQRKRIILGPLARLLLKLFKWDITGTIPNLKKMILIGAPHSAMRDAWYGLLAVLALDLKVTFFGASWIFTRLPSLITFSKNQIHKIIRDFSKFYGGEMSQEINDNILWDY